MGWSLTRFSPPDPGLVDYALLVAGKSLYLANAFESKCRYVLRIANLGAHLEVNPDSSLEDAIVSLARDKLLGATINDLKHFPPVSERQVAALEKARDARNYIAHEGAYFGPLHVKPKHIHEHLAKLRSFLGDLSGGDDVISRWVYEIEEKEVPSSILMQNYQEMIEQWVYGV